jgi:uncharacterized protein
MTTIGTLPLSFSWTVEPESWESSGETLSITGGPKTDLFYAPDGGYESHNVPLLAGTVGGDFQFSARVSVEHRATFDAGSLMLWAGDRLWGKLAFERSVDVLARVVSVITRGFSDDCDSFVVPGGQVWLRISRLGSAFAFHASLDGATWTFVRNFTLDLPDGDVAIGFSAQSPTGDRCTALFDEIRFTPATLADLRDGS